MARLRIPTRWASSQPSFSRCVCRTLRFSCTQCCSSVSCRESNLVMRWCADAVCLQNVPPTVQTNYIYPNSSSEFYPRRHDYFSNTSHPPDPEFSLPFVHIFSKTLRNRRYHVLRYAVPGALRHVSSLLRAPRCPFSSSWSTPILFTCFADLLRSISFELVDWTPIGKAFLKLLGVIDA